MRDVRQLFKRLDLVVRRRPGGRPVLPYLVFRGGRCDEVVRTYADRLLPDGRATVPHASVGLASAKAPASDVALLARIANELSRTMPAGSSGMNGLWGLRLMRFWRIRHALEIDAGKLPASRAARRRYLRDRLFERRADEGFPSGALEPVAESIRGVSVGGVSLAPLARPVNGLAKGLFALRLRFGPGFGWLGRETRGLAGATGDFLDTALALIGAKEGTPTFETQVLLRALLRDLKAATRRSVLSPFRRRRVTPFVVVLERVVPGSPAHRLLTALQDLPSAVAGRHALLVLASLAPGFPDADVPVPPGTPTCSGLADAGAAIDPLVERAHVLQPPALLVDVTDDGPTAADVLWLQSHRRIEPLPVRFAVAVPAAVGVTVLAVGIQVPGLIQPACPDLTDIDGETVGLGDGTGRCPVLADGVPGAPPEIQDAMASVERAIIAENDEVLAGDEPYSTIVFFAPMTVPDDSGTGGENALNQLRGVALAQRQANDAAVHDPDQVRTRLVLANPGDRFAHGDEVAEQIVARAAADDSIVGVVGIGQSRSASRRAIRTLGAGGLPVVAGPVTGDAMIESSPHYFQVSGRNARVAAMLVEFVSNSEIVRTDAGPATADGAVIVMDHTDEYSENLADDLRVALLAEGREEIDMVSHPIEDEDGPGPDADPGRPVTLVSSLPDLARQVCAVLDDRDVVFFTSRAQQFVGSLQSMRNENTCPDTYTVVGGSAVTKVIEDPSSDVSDFDGVDVYYAGFSSRAVAGYSPPIAEFLDAYDEAWGDAVAPDISDAALSFDAYNALQRAASHARIDEFDIDPASAAGALANGQIDFDGASGHVVLGNEPLGSPHQRVPDDKPVLVLEAPDPGEEPALLLACGRFRRGDTAHGTWGPDARPCPTVD